MEFLGTFMSLTFLTGLLTPWGQHQGSRDRAQGRATARGRHAQPCRPGSLPPGFSSPCTFVAAVSGANGTVLWERPVAQNRALVECGVPQPGGSGASSACIILGRPGPFIAVDSVTGRLLPVSPRPPHTGPMPGCSEEGQPGLLWAVWLDRKEGTGGRGTPHEESHFTVIPS